MVTVIYGKRSAGRKYRLVAVMLDANAAAEAINYCHDRNTGGRRYKSPLKVHIPRRYR